MENVLPVVPTDSLEVSVGAKGQVTASLKLRWNTGDGDGLLGAIDNAQATFQMLANRFPTFVLNDSLGLGIDDKGNPTRVA